MKALFRPGLVILSFLFLISCSQNPTQVADAGLGGTGLIPAQGIGGDSGLGGTGLIPESGLGGTGILGTVTGFGSIWVNGVEVETPKDLSIQSDLGGEKIKIGQQVIVETRSDSDRPIAKKLHIYYPLAGQIQAVADQKIRVNNHWVQLSDETLADEGLQLKVGQFVAINAIPVGQKAWQATRLNKNPQQLTFYKPQAPLNFSKDVKQVIIETTPIKAQGQLKLANADVILKDPQEAAKLKPGKPTLIYARWQNGCLQQMRFMQQQRALWHDSEQWRAHMQTMRQWREKIFGPMGHDQGAMSREQMVQIHHQGQMMHQMEDMRRESREVMGSDKMHEKMPMMPQKGGMENGWHRGD